jgi:hypothetical protein
LFQQAFEFTHMLGGTCLWIDSLCIIQDCDSDWSAESQKMAGIYENSKLILAASCAKGSDGDMFYTIADEAERGIKVEGLDLLNLNLEFDIFVRLLPPHRLERFPLMQRAWVYQERILSPRILHFTVYELVWECNSSIQCQCAAESIESEQDFGENTSSRFAKSDFWWSVQWDSESERFSLSNAAKSWKWNSLVEVHSGKNVTFRKDRFSAISGVAKQIQKLGLSGGYLAGLWKDAFFDNIMWRASRDSAAERRCKE